MIEDDIEDDGHEPWLDEEFPRGDPSLRSGQARSEWSDLRVDVEGVIDCPYCGEANEIALDPGSGERQEYVEDCQVCCRPWRVVVEYDASGAAHVQVEPADGD